MKGPSTRERPTVRPCPFCGETPNTESEISFPTNGGFKWGTLQCGCGARGPDVRTDYRPWTEWREKAIGKWNHRADVLRAVGLQP